MLMFRGGVLMFKGGGGGSADVQGEVLMFRGKC